MTDKARIRKHEHLHDDPCISLYCSHNREYHVPQCVFSGCHCKAFEEGPTEEEAEVILREAGIDPKTLANELIDFIMNRHATICRAANDLVERLEAVHADPKYQGVWFVAQLHQGPYDGPTYTAELATLKMLLSEKASESEPRNAAETDDTKI